MASSVMAVLEGFSGMIGSRHEAAEILRKVADAGSYGGFPEDVTCEQLGQALERICLNLPARNPKFAVLRGWCKAERRRDRQLERV